MSPENSKVFTSLKLCLVVALFGSFFISYARIPIWDYDFWWHLASGRFIVTQKHLPDKDPFSLTSNLPGNKNPFPEQEGFILKQYWLAQSLFYLVYSFAGFKGIIFLRSLLLFLALLVVYRQMSRSGVNFFLSIIFIFLLFQSSLRNTGERPVLFTIFFTALIFSILDGFSKSRDKKIFLLIPLMLLWSNIHGGFIIGDLFLLIFIFGEAAKIFFKKSDYSTYERKLFFGAATAAFAASFINPAGGQAFWFAFSSKYAGLKVNIQEWQSPFFLIANKIYPAGTYYPFFVLLALFPLILLIRNKRMDINHILIGSFLWYESIMSTRLIIYFMIPTVVIVARECSAAVKETVGKKWTGPGMKSVGYALSIAAVSSMMFFMLRHFEWKRLIANGVDQSSVPEAAVDFIEKNRIEGNLYNEYAYGGYIAWRLYPWKKNFIDSRSFNIVVMKENEFILNAARLDVKRADYASAGGMLLYDRILQSYKINILLFSQTSMYGDVRPLLLELTDRNDWVPVFCGLTSIVFIRNSEQNRNTIDKFRVPNDDVYNSVIIQSSAAALRDKTNPRHLLALGRIFYKAGRLGDSLRAYQYALKRDPANVLAKGMIEKIRAEMNQAMHGRQG